eukprot:1160374-Pelagomonas_calceolata.AAC.6
MGLAACLYFVVGCCGYLTFKDLTAGDLLRNLGAAHVVVSAARLQGSHCLRPAQVLINTARF